MNNKYLSLYKQNNESNIKEISYNNYNNTLSYFKILCGRQISLKDILLYRKSIPNNFPELIYEWVIDSSSFEIYKEDKHRYFFCKSVLNGSIFTIKQLYYDNFYKFLSNIKNN